MKKQNPSNERKRVMRKMNGRRMEKVSEKRRSTQRACRVTAALAAAEGELVTVGSSRCTVETVSAAAV